MKKCCSLFFVFALTGLALPLRGQALPEPLTVRLSWMGALCQRTETRRFEATRPDDRALAFVLKTLSMRPFEDGTGRVVVQQGDKFFVYDALAHGLVPETGPSAWPPQMAQAPVRIALLPAPGMTQEALWQWRGWAGQALTLAAHAAGLGVSVQADWAVAVGVPVSTPSFTPRKLGRDQEALWLRGGEPLSATLDQALARPPKPGPNAYPTKTDRDLLAWAAAGRSFLSVDGKARPTYTAAPPALCLFRLEGAKALGYRPDDGRWKGLSRGVATALQSLAARYLDEGAVQAAWVLCWDRRVQPQREPVWVQAGALRLNLAVTAALLGYEVRWLPLPSASLEGVEAWEADQRLLALIQIRRPASSVQGKKPALADGTFEGQSGQWPAIAVAVQFTKGRLADLEVVENESDDQYIEPVLNRLPEAMIRSNSWDVDAVSGASLTSTSLIQAVRDAFAKARRAAQGKSLAP